MKTKKSGFLALSVVASVFLCASAALPFEKEQVLRLPAEGLRMLRIDCGSGWLKVSGDAALNEIVVTARITAPGISERRMAEYIAERVRLSLEKEGDTARLVSEIRWRFRLFSFGENARIDLTIRVPKTLALEIDDGSGSVEIEGLGAGLRLDDGSGSIEIRDVAGDVFVDDGSGGISIRRVGGDVSVDDGSGEIEIEDVLGSVEVDDGSGSIRIDRVEKDATILSAGSGSVRIDNVKGRVRR
jgi:DUF4097 and DUF4098 domain-containing protein YvlB